MKTTSRRAFLKSSIAAGGTILTSGVPAFALTRGSANEDIRVAIVGLKQRGREHLRYFREIPGVRIGALCDVDSSVLRERVQDCESHGEKVAAYADFRRVLEDKSIDAVVVASPDHWHALMAVWACQAGKDVYLEKPISHSIWEGRKVIEAARRYDRIVQTGTQSRSDPALQEAFAFIQEGGLGKIKLARGLCYKPRPSIGKTYGPQTVPDPIDYDLWSGPAALRPPRRNTPDWGPVHYDWHWFWDYGCGDIGNQGIHEMDMCRWVLGQKNLPPSVQSLGGRFGYDDDGETPNTQIAVFNYEPAPLIFEVRGLPCGAGEKSMDAYRGIQIGLVVECEQGYFAGGTKGGWICDASGRRLKEFKSAGGTEHRANFISAMRSRRASDLRAPIEEGHVSSALAHMANISYRLGRRVAPDAAHQLAQSNYAARESVVRMLEHLRANRVDLGATPLIDGPLLKPTSSQDAFQSDEKYDSGFWATTMVRQGYRPPFVIPEVV